MAVSIGRLGWTGISFQSGWNVPSVPTDYYPWSSNNLMGNVEQLEIKNAQAIRDSLFSTVGGKQHGAGEIKNYLDMGLCGYMVGAALGTKSTTNIGGGVYQHNFSRNNSNTPLYLSIINDRVTDREYFSNVAVSSLEISCGIDLAEISAKVVSAFPATTTSGTYTTISGRVMSFKNAQFGVGSTVNNALSTLYNTTSVKLTIDNSTEPLYVHASATPYAIVHKDFKVTAEIELFFENTTDKLNYYNQPKNAAVLRFLGNTVSGAYNDLLTFNLYQTSIKSFEVTTGLDDFHAEKVNLVAEYSVNDSKTIDATLVNGNNNY